MCEHVEIWLPFPERLVASVNQTGNNGTSPRISAAPPQVQKIMQNVNVSSFGDSWLSSLRSHLVESYVRLSSMGVYPGEHVRVVLTQDSGQVSVLGYGTLFLKM